MKNYQKALRIVLVCLIASTLVISTFGCASTKRVADLESQVATAMQKADAATAAVQEVKAASEECCASSEEAVKAANAAADRAESAASKAEAIFNKNLKK